MDWPRRIRVFRRSYRGAFTYWYWHEQRRFEVSERLALRWARRREAEIVTVN